MEASAEPRWSLALRREHHRTVLQTGTLLVLTRNKLSKYNSQMPTRAISKYIQYFWINDFSGGGFIGSPVADTGIGALNSGLQEAFEI